MKTFTTTDALSALCKLNDKFGMYINCTDVENSDENFFCSEFKKAAPYLDKDEYLQILFNGYGWMLFDSEEEMLNVYHQTVGDDGPAKLNPYNGKTRVYAITCDSNGQLLDENT